MAKAGETDPEFMGRLAERLKTLRERTGRSRRSVAKAAGIGESTARNWEENQNDPNPTMQGLNAYLRECDATIGELFEPWLADDPRRVDDYVEKVVRRSLRDTKKRRWILMIIELLEATAPSAPNRQAEKRRAVGR